MFPSPLGVIFSLIQDIKWINNEALSVSVSSRSYILSYEIKMTLKPMILKVSVSSRSYILSYFPFNVNGSCCTRFRLLSELYSLLSYSSIFLFICQVFISFRLLSELYSLLSDLLEKTSAIDGVSVSSRSYILSYSKINGDVTISNPSEFPSPLGVIFSLM